jgi:hypothetical protein
MGVLRVLAKTTVLEEFERFFPTCPDPRRVEP